MPDLVSGICFLNDGPDKIRIIFMSSRFSIWLKILQFDPK